MSTNTETLGLFKYDSTADANSNFNVKQALNDNWDKVDTNAKDTNTKFDDINKDYVRMPGVGVATASGNSYSISTDPAPTSYVDGIGVMVRIQSNSTGSATLNWNGLGAKALKNSSGEDVSLKKNAIYFFRYSTATGNFIMVNEIPTKTSQLTNDSGFITAADIPTSLPANGGHASTADKWQTSRNIALTGDVTGSASVDGSANASIATTLKNSGVAVGTYRSVTVDAKGRVTAGTNPTTRDGYGLSDVYTKSESDDNFAPSGYGLGGIGKRLGSGIDANTVINNGWYDINNSTNLPSDIGTGYAKLLVICSADIDYITQLAFSMTTGTVGTMYIREKRVNTWGSWIRIANMNDIAFTNLLNKPTTLSGYGITDGALKTDVQDSVQNSSTQPTNQMKGGIWLAPI